MKFTGAVILVALALPAAAWAQTSKPDVSSAPSAQNSGAGIAGQPGNKSGPPPVKPGETVGSSSTGSSSTNATGNPAVQSQDPANIQGAPGSKSGPPAKRPDQR